MGSGHGFQDLKAIAINIRARKISAFNGRKIQGLGPRSSQYAERASSKNQNESSWDTIRNRTIHEAWHFACQKLSRGSIENIEEIGGKRFIKSRKKKPAATVA